MSFFGFFLSKPLAIFGRSREKRKPLAVTPASLQGRPAGIDHLQRRCGWPDSPGFDLDAPDVGVSARGDRFEPAPAGARGPHLPPYRTTPLEKGIDSSPEANSCPHQVSASLPKPHLCPNQGRETQVGPTGGRDSARTGRWAVSFEKDVTSAGPTPNDWVGGGGWVGLPTTADPKKKSP